MSNFTNLQRKKKPDVDQNARQKITRTLDSAGKPLDGDIRSFVESRFGHDFSDVQIHSDAQASGSAKAVNSLAYTVGNNIVFADAQYNPETPEGFWLLTHELAHVIQQNHGKLSGINKENEMSVSQSGSESEKSADQAADAILGGETATMNPISPQGFNSMAIQRKEGGEEHHFWDNPIFKAISTGAGFIPGPVGMAAKVMRSPFQAVRGAEAAGKGDGIQALAEFGSMGAGLASAAASAGGFSMLGGAGASGLLEMASLGGVMPTLQTLGTVGGLGAEAGATMSASSVLTGGGLSGTAALGPAAAVAGAGLAGFAGGRLLDRGVDWVGDQVSGNPDADHSISGALGDAAYAADSAISGLVADPSKPAYQQTLGWKINDWLESF